MKSLVIGHRGASGYRPEHTRAAYEIAFALGAEAVEPDLVATKDGVLVIRHENEISSTTDVADHAEFAHLRTAKEVDGRLRTGWFTEDFTWEQLRTLRAVERLPRLRQASAGFDGLYPLMRLEELFELVDAASARTVGERRHPLGLVVEIKHATYFESLGLPLDDLFAQAVRDAGWNDPNRLVVESFERTVLSKVRGRGVRGRAVYLVEAEGAPYDAVARDGSAARGYAEDIDGKGLYELAAATGDDAIDGISVSKTLLLGDGSGDAGDAGDVGVVTTGTGTGTGEAARGSAGRAVGSSAASSVDLVDRAHGVGLQLFCWTLRPENRYLAPRFRRDVDPGHWGDWRGEFTALFDAGVDAVFADHPDLALVARDGL